MKALWRSVMRRQITDEDIRTFLRKNWVNYPSQISLMQETIRLLWPGGAPTNGMSGLSGFVWKKLRIVRVHNPQKI